MTCFRARPLVLIWLLMLLWPLTAGAQAEDKRPTWYAQALARGAAGVNVTYFWSLGPMLRAETVVAGHKIVTIVNGDTYYAFDGLSMNGVAIRRASAAAGRYGKPKRPSMM